MKAKKLITVLTAVTALNIFFPSFAAAESLDSLSQQESAIKEQSDQISVEVQMALDDVNAKYTKLEDSKSEIAKNEATLTKTKAQIKETEENIQKRKAQVGERLKSIQLNGGAEQDWTALLDVKNLQEFVNRAYAMTFLQNIEKEKIESLGTEKENLSKLTETVEKTQAELKDNQASLEQDTAELDSKIANLKERLATNQNALQQIAQSKAVEEQRLAAEKAKAEKAAAEKAKAEQAAKEAAKQQAEASESSSSESSTSESQTNQSSSEEEPAKEESKPNNNQGSDGNNSGSSSTGGKVLYMESTAYSWREPGASPYTASGTDLRKNPMAVAVDPSVIPLGTLVNVQGYGVALALDTGGAIKGKILDVHFDNVQKCGQWGRRYNVKVTILD